MTAVDRMAGHLTAPFGCGADRTDLAFSDRFGTVAPYDFAEHVARYGAQPKPRYVLWALVDVVEDTVVTANYDVGTSHRSCTIAVPAGTAVGSSFMLPLGADAPTAVLRSVALTPRPRGELGSVARNWRLSVLLGDLAALLWTIGAERDVVTAQLAKAREQRSLPTAFGASLDLIGSDLGVPRLPPTPYIHDSDTIALYHLNDPAGSTTATDATALYQAGAGRPATVDRVTLGVPGRFGTAASFDGAGGSISIPDDQDFALDLGMSLTVECFAKPADGAWQGDLVRKQPDDLTKPGWTLSIGDFGRGIDRNLRLVVTDGTNAITLYADISLDPTEFAHVAAAVDRRGAEVRLSVNGVPRAKQDLGQLGKATNTEPVRIGDAGYHGLLDEVRFSRVGQTEFHPVLGESDESFAQRLGMFREWKLPTRANIEALINKAVGDRVEGALFPFVVNDVDALQFAGTRPVAVRPARLNPRESMDALGRRDLSEAEVCGVAADDPFYDPALLVDGSDPRIAYWEIDDPTHPHASRLMRPGTRKALLALQNLLDQLGIPQQLEVSYGYLPGADDLRAVGRGLAVFHGTVPADRLAALAQRAGFSWVTHRADTDDVYASVADTTTFEILDTGQGTASRGRGFDFWEGGSFVLRLDPEPPTDATVRWSIIHYGPGRAAIDDDPTLPRPTFRAIKAGRLTVRAEVRRGGRTYLASRQLRLGLGAVPQNDSIGSDGTRGVDESVAGTLTDAPFLPTYLTKFSDPRVTADDPQALRMQPALATIFKRMLDLVITPGVTGTIRLRSGYQPIGDGLERVGRALIFDGGTASISPDWLAAAAHSAGFDYVHHVGSTPPTIHVAHRAEDLVTIDGPADVEEGTSTQLQIAPHAQPRAIASDGTYVCTLNAGTNTVSSVDPLTGKVVTTTEVGLASVGIATVQGSGSAFVAEGDSKAISVVNLATQQASFAMPVPSQPVAIAGHPSAQQVVIATVNSLIVMSALTYQVTLSVALPTTPTTLALDPTGATAWVGFADGTLRSVALSGMTVSTPVPLPGAPTDLAVGPTAVYAVNGTQLSIVDLPGRGVRAADGVGPAPHAVAYDQTANAVYLSDGQTGQIQIRAADGTQLTPPRQVRPAGLVTDLVATPNRVYASTIADPALGGADAVGVLQPSTGLAPLAFWALGSGYGERLSVSVRTGVLAAARLDRTTSSTVDLLAQTAGPLEITARYTAPGVQPYAVRIELTPYLTSLPTAVIPKEAYDLVMNALSEFHPIGVEIDTSVLRKHVLELQAGLLDVLPADTYPTYRLRGPLPARTAQEDNQ